MPNPDLAAAFAPFTELAGVLLPHAFDAGDGAHDGAHLIRVFRNAMRIHKEEGGDARILAAAVLLHDCVSVEKSAPNRADASRLAAEKAWGLLDELGWRSHDIAAVAHAILAHSFSAGIPPESLEARILQDADRLDAIGMIGAARLFYVAGRMGSQLYDPLDPEARLRNLDDRLYAFDHFEVKLFKLADGFQTETGSAMARVRTKKLWQVRDMLIEEIK